MKTHEQMVREWMQDPAFVQAYDGLYADAVGCHLEIKMVRVPSRRGAAHRD